MSLSSIDHCRPTPDELNSNGSSSLLTRTRKFIAPLIAVAATQGGCVAPAKPIETTMPQTIVFVDKNSANETN